MRRKILIGGSGLVKMLWVRVYDMIFSCILISYSSPFLFMFDDDHVTCNTRVDDVVGDDVEA